MLYRLSKLVPVRMRSAYGAVQDGSIVRSEYATWWQWRGRIFRHRVQVV